MTKRELRVLGRKPTDSNWQPLILSDRASIVSFLGDSLVSINLPMGIELWKNDEFPTGENEENILLYENNESCVHLVKGNAFLVGTNEKGEIASLSDEQMSWIRKNSKIVYYKPNLIPVCRINLWERGL